MTRRQSSRSRGRLDESSGDELADTAILYNVPHELASLPSSHSLGTSVTEDITRPKSSRSTKTMGDDADKPLPPIPVKASEETHQRQRRNRPALTKKTTNLKTINTEAKPRAKPMISPPVLRETTNSSLAFPDSSRPMTSDTANSAFAPQTSTADAEDLNRKISTLMAQAAAQEEQTRLKTDAYISDSIKASPLQRSKNAFVKASRAIKERLSNGSVDRSPKLKRPLAKRYSSFQESSPLVPPTVWQYEILNGLSRERLDRRIAEGENLSNPKIRSLTGDGNIPRKPLPVYESMRSRSMLSISAEDPFTDGKEGDGVLPAQDYSGFDFDFSNHKHKGKADHYPEDPMEVDMPVDETSSETPNPRSTAPQSTSRFSNMISGLAQHPDVMYFSSPPLDHSTPRVRLEPHVVANTGDHIRQSPTCSPSVPNASLEDNNDSVFVEAPSPQRHQARLSDGSNLSVKRKEATEDLRAHVAPMAKKAKTDSAGSDRDLNLVEAINELVTEDERIPLSPKSVNRQDFDPSPNASKRKGMSIFDVGKGKAREGKEDEKFTQRPRTRPSAVKRSSITRPSSSLFNRGRDSRHGMHRSMQADDDSMDIDELQIDDATFQVRGRRR